MTNKTLWTRSFIAVSLANLFLFLSFQLFPSALPPYLKSLGAADNILGLTQGIFTAATLMVRPFAGTALDRYGRRGIFLIGIIGMLVATAAYALFPIVGVILFVRFLHGIVWAISSTACSTIASDNIEKSRFAEGMGYFSLLSSVAIAIAPAIALSLGMPKSVWLACVFLLVCVVFALIIKYPKTAVVETEKKRQFPYTKESILPSGVMLFVTVSYGAVVTFLALYGAERGIVNVGLFFTVYAVSMLIARPFLGRLVDKKGFGAGIWPGVILTSAALFLLSFSHSMPMFLACAVLYGVGMGAAQGSLQAMAVIKASPQRMGAANATFYTGFDGGIGIGSIAAGIIAGLVGYGGMFAVIALFPLIGGVVYFIFARREKLKQ